MRNWLALTVMAGLAAAQEPVAVRILPQPLAANGRPSRLGLQVGFLAGPDNPLAADCLSAVTPLAEKGVAVRVARHPDTDEPVYGVSNAGGAAGGLSLGTAALRRGRRYTVRVRCRLDKGGGLLVFRFAPAQARPGDGTEKAVSVKGEGFVEKVFAVTPWRDGAFQCAFRVEPGAEMAFAGFSMLPDGADGDWDSQALEALRAMGVGVLRWPVERGVGFYNWYLGVGPRAYRQVASPLARPGHGNDFGTIEFVRLCRLVGAEPLIRVALCLPGCGVAGAEDLAVGAQLAADWVAYCNAPSNQPLGALRARHGCASPLTVRRWELAVPEGLRPDVAVFAEACRATAAAMREADPACEIGLRLEKGEHALLAHARARAGGLLAWADTNQASVCDGYVSGLLARLAAGDAAERDYYAGWYGALSLMNGALRHMRERQGDIFAPLGFEQLLRRAATAGRMPTDAGRLVALYNRYPAEEPLAVEGVTGQTGEPFQVAAAWTEGRSLLVVFVYNSGAEPRAVRLDLAPLKRRFMFWASEQLAAEIAGRRETETVPVTRRQKAGSALAQVVVIECRPASFTRVVVKE
jgi:hypothetical protein